MAAVSRMQRRVSSSEDSNPLADVIVVDPHPVVREGLRLSLERDPALRIIAEAEDALAAFFAGRQHAHSVLLINAILPGSNTLDVVRDYAKAFSGVKILTCSVAEDAALVADFLGCGCSGLLGRDAKSKEYIAATHAVLAGGIYLSANLAHRLLADRSASASRAGAYGLTGREIDVLRLLTNGLSNKEVANRLGLSVRTVEAHRLRIRQKTSAGVLSELVRIARAIGLSPMGGASYPGAGNPPQGSERRGGSDFGEAGS